jgi:anti-anti-sigma factor
MEIERAEGSRTLLLVGEVDMSNVDRFRDALGTEVEEVGSAVLDLSRCTYIGSEGIGVIVEVWNRTPEDGRILLRGATPHVRRVLETAGLGRFPRLEIEGGP